MIQVGERHTIIDNNQGPRILMSNEKKGRWLFRLYRGCILPFVKGSWLAERQSMMKGGPNYRNEMQGFFRFHALSFGEPGSLGFVIGFAEYSIIIHYRNPYQTAGISWKVIASAFLSREEKQIWTGYAPLEAFPNRKPRKIVLFHQRKTLSFQQKHHSFQ